MADAVAVAVEDYQNTIDEEEMMVITAAEEVEAEEVVAAEEVDAAVGEEKLPEDVGEELTGAVEEGTNKFIYFLLF